MTFPSPSQLEQSIPAHERALLKFSLRLHLLYRSLLRVPTRTVEEASGWTACAAEAVNDLYHQFVVRTSARLEHAFAAMHGQELRRWEDHLADIIRRSNTEDACSPDLLDEMKAIVGSGEELLPLLENGSAKEIALMLAGYRRDLVRLEASRPGAGAKIFFLRGADELRTGDWDRVLDEIWREQDGPFAPVKAGSWRSLRTALNDVAETLPVRVMRPLSVDIVPVLETIPGRRSGVVGFSLTSGERIPR
jgi:hypothetical protein